jgi:hypothetical protein
VTEHRIKCNMSPKVLLSFFERGLLLSVGSLRGLFRDTRVAFLPSVVSGGVFICSQDNSLSNTALNTKLATSADFILTLAFITCFFCDTACSTVIELFAGRLIAPFWHRVRERRPASSTNSTGTIRSLRQWLSSPCRIEKNSRPYRSIQISHNPPPHIPLLSTHCCI